MDTGSPQNVLLDKNIFSPSKDTTSSVFTNRPCTSSLVACEKSPKQDNSSIFDSLTVLLDMIFGDVHRVLQIINVCVTFLFFLVGMMLYHSWDSPMIAWLYIGFAAILACFAFTLNWMMVLVNRQKHPPIGVIDYPNRQTNKTE